MLKPCDLDPKAVRRQADRAARHASPPDFIARRIEAGMLERLDLVRLQPARVLDVGSGRGQGTAALATRYPEALCVGVDLSVPALKHGLAATEAASAASGWLRRTVAAIRAAGGGDGSGGTGAGA